MASRPDVMQLLCYFSTEKHRLTINEGRVGAKTGQILFVWVCVLVFRSENICMPGKYISDIFITAQE